MTSRDVDLYAPDEFGLISSLGLRRRPKEAAFNRGGAWTTCSVDKLMMSAVVCCCYEYSRLFGTSTSY